MSEEKLNQLKADISAYLAHRFCGEDVPFDECDDEAEWIVAKVGDRIKKLEAELEKTRAMVLAEQERYGQCTANEKKLEQENARLASALEKIADKRKRDHQEPDAYTELGCVMNIAHQALEGREK